MFFWGRGGFPPSISFEMLLSASLTLLITILGRHLMHVACFSLSNEQCNAGADFTHILNLVSVRFSSCIHPSRSQMTFSRNPIQIVFIYFFINLPFKGLYFHSVFFQKSKQEYYLQMQLHQNQLNS